MFDTERIDLADGLYLNVVQGYRKILVLEGYKDCNGFIQLNIEKHDIRMAFIKEKFRDCIFDELVNVVSIIFRYNETFSVEEFYKLKKLMSIEMDDTYKMAIDFSKFKELVDLDLFWNPNISFVDADKLKYLILRKYGKESFEQKLPKNIEFLELIQGKLKSMKGIEEYQSLKALVLYAQPKIEDYTAISGLKNLEFLHIHGGHLKDVSFITKLKNLKWLVLENCKEIETLKPLLKLDKLEGVQLAGSTKIVDGDRNIRDIKSAAKYNYPYSMIKQRLYKDI